MTDYSRHNEIRQLLEKIINRRARIVIEHILENGFITTEQLEKQYGYNHPPRAARDVREAGIPLETFRVKDSEGRTIAAYKFGDLNQMRSGRLAGRQTFPKIFKDALYAEHGGKCSICNGNFEQRYLQVDHRIPYEVTGDSYDDFKNEHFMLVCGSCNRAKSWSCEHCANWKTGRSSLVCLKCYWANPEEYVHVSLKEIRRTDILWSENEVQVYEGLKELAIQDQSPIPDYVKKVMARHIIETKGK